MSTPKFVKNIKSGRIFPYDPKFDPSVLVPYDEGTETILIDQKPPSGVPLATVEQMANPVPTVPESSEVAPKDMHWTQLRKLVTDAGGVYTNRDDAIEFLKNETGQP